MERREDNTVQLQEYGGGEADRWWSGVRVGASVNELKKSQF